MSLIFRILAAVVSVVVVAASIPLILGGIRQQQQDRTIEELRLQLVETQWQSLLDTTLDRVTGTVLEELDDNIYKQSLRTGDPAWLNALLVEIDEEFGDDFERLDLYAGGELLASTAVEFLAESLLSEQAALPLDNDRRWRGVQLRDDMLLGVDANPILDDGRLVGTAVVTVRLEPTLTALANALRSEVFVIGSAPANATRHGAAVPAPASDLVATRETEGSAVSLITLRDRTYERVFVDLVSPFGVRIGALVSARDVTDEVEQAGLVRFVETVGAVIAGLAALFCLFLFLGAALRPLRESIDALTQLAAGEHRPLCRARRIRRGRDRPAEPRHHGISRQRPSCRSHGRSGGTPPAPPSPLHPPPDTGADGDLGR